MAIADLVVPSYASSTDKSILAPKIQELIVAVNALSAQSAETSTGVVIAITAEQEAALEAVPLGGLFRLAGPTLDIPCQKG